VKDNVEKHFSSSTLPNIIGLDTQKTYEKNIVVA
jgi:hypothetical protein